MTHQEAYSVGFRKAAELIGVQPAVLQKRAIARDAILARLGRGRQGVKSAADHSFGNLASEVIGHTGGNAAILGTLGLAAGPVGVVAGTAAGGLGIPLGGLLALIKRRRTAAEQVAYDSNSHILKNLLVPGAGSYNMWKRIGRIVGSHMEKKSADAAYVDGFCKAAELVGADPVALYKQAIAVGDIASLGLKAWNGLRGAGTAAAKAVRNPKQTLATAKGMGSRYLELLRGGNANVRGAFGMGKGDLASMGKLKGYAQTYAEGLRGGMGADAASELRKVVGARGVTAGGLLGGGALAMRGGNGGQPQAAQDAQAAQAAQV